METQLDKACNICGGVGLPNLIVTCCECNEIRKHVYCMHKLSNEVPENWVCESCSSPESSGEEDTLQSPYYKVQHDVTHLSGSCKVHDDSAHEPTMGVKHMADHRSVTLNQKSTIATSSSWKGKEKLEMVEETNNSSLQKEDIQGLETMSRGENQTVVHKITVSDRAPTTMSTSLKHCKFKKFGITKYRPRDSNLNIPVLHLDHESHISYENKSCMKAAKVYGNMSIIPLWYAKLPQSVKEKVDKSGFGPFIAVLKKQHANRVLIQSLAEKWWDTTHTFHFDEVGEITMTPKDFSAITGLPVSGKPILYDLDIHLNSLMLEKLVGKPLSTCRSSRVSNKWIAKTYSNFKCDTPENEDILTRVFILVLLNSTLFCDGSSKAKLCYIPSLAHVNEIIDYNWGGAALSCLYCFMDAICRGKSIGTGGYWKAWEVWAYEYLPCMRLKEPVRDDTTFPRALRWLDDEEFGLREQRKLVNFQTKIRNLKPDEVAWQPWGSDDNLPQYVIDSLQANRQRILLHGPAGRAWYLGERVSKQSLGSKLPLVPKVPPKSMLCDWSLTEIDLTEAINGWDASKFIDSLLVEDYDSFRKKWLTYHYYNKAVKFENKAESSQAKGKSRKGKIQAKAKDKETVIGCDIEMDSSKAKAKSKKRKIQATAKEKETVIGCDIEIPPWTFLVPGLKGGTELVRIPHDSESPYLPLPPNVHAVSTESVTALLHQISGCTSAAMDLAVRNVLMVQAKDKEIEELKNKLRIQEEKLNLYSKHAQNMDVGDSENVPTSKLRKKRVRSMKACFENGNSL